MVAESFAVRNDAERAVEAESLAASLNLPLQDCASGPQRFLLEFDRDGRLTLRDTASRSLKPLRVDLEARYRGRGADPLLRALGSHRNGIIDCTAGLGADASHLAASGNMVTAIERHPIIHALLADALANCRSANMPRRLRLICADATSWLERTGSRPDIICLDPMYPPPPGSAAPRKALQILRQLVDHDAEADRRLLEAALGHARHRVVVKRPHHAPPILPGNQGEIRGKLVRFDIYRPFPP
jgi:16S rRNA (guanine1516-N2)-methyltransferase